MTGIGQKIKYLRKKADLTRVRLFSYRTLESRLNRRQIRSYCPPLRNLI